MEVDDSSSVDEAIEEEKKEFFASDEPYDDKIYSNPKKEEVIWYPKDAAQKKDVRAIRKVGRRYFQTVRHMKEFTVKLLKHRLPACVFPEWQKPLLDEGARLQMCYVPQLRLHATDKELMAVPTKDLKQA